MTRFNKHDSLTSILFFSNFNSKSYSPTAPEKEVGLFSFGKSKTVNCKSLEAIFKSTFCEVNIPKKSRRFEGILATNSISIGVIFFSPDD